MGYQEKDHRKEYIVIIGAGGHAVSVANVALSAGYKIKCFYDKSGSRKDLLGYKVVGDIGFLINTNEFAFAIAVGDNEVRENIFNEMSRKHENVYYPPLIHRTALISSFCSIGAGVLVMPHAVVGPNSWVGKFCLINTRASIDHDCVMHDFSSVAPGATTGGGVKIGYRAAVSLGAVIKEKIIIGDNSIVGANSFLNKDLGSNLVAIGSPAVVVRDA